MKRKLILFSAAALAVVARASGVSDAPEVHGPFTLAAAFDSSEGHNAFFFAGKTVPLTIGFLPGNTINVS